MVMLVVTLAIISIVVGAMLAHRFRVFVLAPAILLGSAVTAGVGIAGGYSAWWIVPMCILVTVGVQLGYMAGAIDASRAARTVLRYRHTT